MVVQSRPADASREDEYNDWYSHTHIPQILGIPGFVGARRFKRTGDDPETSPYLAVYEIEADNLTQAVGQLRDRSAAGEMTMSDAMAMDPPPAVALYELIE